jgi:hypothetical protein
VGGQTFSQNGKGKTAKEAFQTARAAALYEYGHRGYTGSLAEKHEFVLITPPAGVDPVEFARDLVDKGDPRVDDKWGPAGCVKVAPDEYMFFGWASS